AVLGSFSDSLPQLIAFVKHPCIFRVDPNGFVERTSSLVRIAEHIEIADSKIAPSDRERWIQLGGTFPLLDRLSVSAPVVKEVAQIILSPRICRIDDNRTLE